VRLASLQAASPEKHCRTLVVSSLQEICKIFWLALKTDPPTSSRRPGKAGAKKGMTTAAHFRHWFLCSISDNEKGLDDRLGCVKIGRTVNPAWDG
jgi:hypothetical protein